MKRLNLFNHDRHADSTVSTAVNSNANSMEIPAAAGEKQGRSSIKDLPRVTLKTIFMTILVAMGGFIFGYDTGQISGFLEMQVFLERFGEQTFVSTKNPSGYYFTNVRSGLIVAMVCQLNYNPPDFSINLE